jgi:serine kinase of HPr protein (carbohydrate metabolism regulator)
VTGDTVPQLAYGTCVALRTIAALLEGPSGSGKSDLALRFVLGTPAAADAALVSDDQVLIERSSSRLLARPPMTIAGKIEVRGIGIVELPYLAEAELRLVIRLGDAASVERLPQWGDETAQFCGISLPVLRLSPFEASAPLKLRLMLERVV